MTQGHPDRWDRAFRPSVPSSGASREGDRRMPSSRGGGIDGRQWERPQRRMTDAEFESATWSRAQQVRERRDVGGEQVRGGSSLMTVSRTEETRRLEQREVPHLERREVPRWGQRSTEASSSSSRGGPGDRGFRDHRVRGDFHAGDRASRGGRFDAVAPAEGPNRDRRAVVKRGNWNFWTLLCGAADSQVTFTEYKGICPGDNQRDYMKRGWIKVPLFQQARDEEIHERFREKLRSIASAVAKCEELSDEKCQLLAHIRVGDLFLFHKFFQFDQRPGPKLEDLNLLMEEESFPAAREQLDRFFRDNDREQRIITSTFVTEKFCGSHATIEACLSLHEFSLDPEEELALTVSLNGDKHKFELIYGLRDLRLLKILIFTHKWNLNLVTGKGTNYQGTFKEKADLRLQFDASFWGETDEKVNAYLAEDKLNIEDLQQLFERVDENPVPPSAADSPPLLSEFVSSGRLYRLKQPQLAPRLTYFREQYNRKFAKRHDRWPLLVLLRQFRFFELGENSKDVFVGPEMVELRVSAELDCKLGREELDEPEFVTQMWNTCQLMQELVATSLEV